MRRLNSSVILELLQDSDFENRTLSSVRNVLRKAGAVEQEERQFVDTFVRVWMEYNQPLSDTPSLLQAVLENGEFFNSKPELLRNYLLLLAKNTPDQFDMVKLWVSVAMSYLPILKDWFLSHIWNHIVETCWSMDAKDLANSEFCAKFPRLLETLSNTDDAIQYANLYKSSFCSVQFTSRSSESISDFILELESALCEDSRVKSSVTLTFVRFLTAPEVLKGFSVLGIERVGEFLGCVLLHVENDSETFGDLVGSVKQYLNGLSYNEMEDLVFHIFRSAFNRLRVRIEDMEPLHSLQEILCSAMEALSLSSQETGKKIGYDLIGKFVLFSLRISDGY